MLNWTDRTEEPDLLDRMILTQELEKATDYRMAGKAREEAILHLRLLRAKRQKENGKPPSSGV